MSIYSDLMLKDGPNIYLRLNESGGTTANDISGNGNNGTYTGSGLTFSQTGAILSDADTAILFNGSSGRCTFSSGAGVIGWSELTVEAWIKLSTNSFGHLATIWATGTTPTNNGDGFKFWIGQNGVNGGIALGVSGNHWTQATFSQTFTAGVWYHVCASWDDGSLQLYVNGVKNGTASSLSGSIDDTGHNIALGYDPQSSGDYFPGTIDEAATNYRGLEDANIQAHYAAGIAQVKSVFAPPFGFITNPPGNVLLLIDDVWYPTIRQESIKIDRTANDPIPTFTFVLQDDPSHIPIQELSEIVFIDAGQIANPTHNLLLNSSLNPYTVNWVTAAHTGLALSQTGGGGLTITATNAAINTFASLTQIAAPGDIVPGQSYMFSATVQGGGSPTNIQAFMELLFLDSSGATLNKIDWYSSLPVSTSATRVSLTGVAPTGTNTIQIWIGINTSSTTNSGTVTYTQTQLEPMCFTQRNYRLAYPTPWCDTSQTNCFVLPDGTTVRQLRLFGGLITKSTAGAYIGNNRQWSVTASGYAWLLGKQILNDTWTAQTDSTIINTIVNKYFPSVFSTLQVSTINEFQNSLSYSYNGYARDAIDTLAGTSTNIYYIDAYRTFWYQPPGFNTLPFELSDNPDNITSWPYYAYSIDYDATQLGNAVYVSGTQGVAAIEIDAQSVGIYSQQTNGTGMFWRTVNDSSIATTSAALNRGIGEAGTYGYSRPIAHLTTNQFMIPGYTVYVTSSSDGLSRVPFLVQKSSLVLTGFLSLFRAVYECQCDLGAFNPDLTNVIARVMRKQVIAGATQSGAQTSYYGPVNAPVPILGIMATEEVAFRDKAIVSVTSLVTVAGVPATWYGTAGAVYGSNLVGYQ